MHRFALLFKSLDTSTATLDKRAALVAYFEDAPPRDAVWALYFLCGGKITSAKQKIATSKELRQWVSAITTLPAWLVDSCYHQVGDLAETLALLVISPKSDYPQHSLADWIENILLPIANQPEEQRQIVIQNAWQQLPSTERLLFNKLLTGSLRVGVSQKLVQQALAIYSGVELARIAQRMLGKWEPNEYFFSQLLSQEILASDSQQPYPFYLASPLEAPVESLGAIGNWMLEWKWDGIRLQLLKRDQQIALWSRGEERLDGRFPELEQAARLLPDNTVLDGELMIWLEDESQPRPFTQLQTRIQRKKPSQKFLTESPAILMIYDLLEWQGQDLRERSLRERRELLHQLFCEHTIPAPLKLSPLIHLNDWQTAAALREQARERNTEGLMLKRAEASYLVGRKRGDWWKWKIAPLTIDAVLLYAQAGHGRRSSLYTDYTFGVWDGDQLVPIAKAYSGLTDKEINSLDKWIRSHTLDRFGPVRQVAAEQVFEIAFEAVNHSTRHKSGIAVRFPRILRWRIDKAPKDADQLSTLKNLAQ